MVDESAAKKLQAKLEQKISDWSLQRLRWDKRLKHIKIRMVTIGTLILLLQAIHLFVPHLTVPPYNSMATMGLSIWLVVLAVKYAIGYKDIKCSRSADEIIQLAADYNEAIKDIPNARHCDFLPPELVQHKRDDFTAKAPAGLPIQAVPRI